MRVKEFKKDGFVVELDEGEGDPDKLIALQCKNPLPTDDDDSDQDDGIYLGNVYEILSKEKEEEDKK
jgi:hypothetical protein